MQNLGTVLNVQRFTLHDGPGIRTEFFLKGCPLRCDWCGNPESFNRRVELGVYHNRCITSDNCGSCQQVCPDTDMLIFSSGQLNEIDRNKCSACLECYEECPSEAIHRWGEQMSVERCMKVIRKDIGFYTRSGGGVTISGGEPLMQTAFVLELLTACKQEGIHTCVESSLFANWNRVEALLPYTDLFIADIKLMDNQRHKQATSVENTKILSNLIRLSKTNKELILRVPVVPSINDDMENMKATADFILNDMEKQPQALQLLSFMRLGEEKYESLGLPYKMKDLEFDRAEFQLKVDNIAAYFNQRGIHCLVGTKEKSSQ